MTWTDVRQALVRPYPVTIPMVALVSLVPVYLLIADIAKAGRPHVPALPLDHLLPVVPAWALIYGALYAFLIVVPVFVVQDRALVDRTVWAYLAVWTAAFACFLVYPTVAPRPAAVPGDGFAAWGLRFLYDADPPYNCFPSLHVAHSFVSAFAVGRVHRPLGRVTLACAWLVALSTLFTKQHYVLDLLAGILLAWAAHAAFLRRYPVDRTGPAERRVAPGLALCAAGLAGLFMACYWVAWLVTART
jgi:membrane-associated phospholipid phosphatase